ncbi:MAG: hypothetical protein H0T46_26265 [Deltaproteobacteria bacterium]|nr:hypothetical protein [Deltaproteobacteria bacterium]
MLGKSVGSHRIALALVLGVGLGAAACAHNVGQDSNSGTDGKVKGAKALVMESGEAKSSGIVTYPGGDRIDWKLIELPEKSKGTLDLKLTWTPPRPGLQLAFDVFDEWNSPVGETKGKKRGRGRSKTMQITGAKGKYFVRVYAVGRGDAGKYRLTAEFKEAIAGIQFDPLKLEIPEPPKLAAVPEPEVPCDEFAFDPKNPACKMICPKAGAPAGWPPCKDVCPTPPDINIPSCQATMPCPNPPDRRVKSCKPSQWPKCNLAAPDPQNPNCDNAKADPVTTRVLKYEVQGSDTILTIGAGTNQGIGKAWKATVLRGDSDAALSGGEVIIIRVDKGATVGKVRLTTDQVKANDRVKFSPP